MLVSPISYNAQYNYRPQIRNRNAVSFGVNNLSTIAKNSEPLFKRLSLKTTHDLYNTEFVPSGLNVGKYSYPTFVFDDATRKVNEVFVIPMNIQENKEEYMVINSGRLIGSREFSVDNMRKLITPGYMLSMEGIGTGNILHQIAFERMLMKGFDNIKIDTISSASRFHKSMGFEPIGVGDYMMLSPESISDWMKIVNKHPIFIGKEFPEGTYVSSMEMPKTKWMK